MTDRRPTLSVEPFGRMPDGREVALFHLTDGAGLRVSITNYGCAITSLWTPDRAGNPADIALGYDTLEGYLGGKSYFGAIVGRVGNRIAGGSFSLNGKNYILAKNDGPNHLHGGRRGFDRTLWDAAACEAGASPALTLSTVSSDGDEGYPGNLRVAVIYTLPSAGTLQIQYRAESDQPTPLNLTNHSYFNLAGHDAAPILGHEVTILADRFTPTNATLIPTGALQKVDGTALDFRTPRIVGERIDSDDEQLRLAGGYDQNYVLADAPRLAPVLAAQVSEPASGRRLEVLTTEPGMQFYSGNFLSGAEVGKGGAVYHHRTGFCLETQHFPDSPNQPSFPPAILRPGEVFESTTIYRFSAR